MPAAFVSSESIEPISDESDGWRGLQELEGKECAIVFDLPLTEWPILGYPAHVTVHVVDKPMMKVSPIYGHDFIWINFRNIKSIRVVEYLKTQEQDERT